MRKLILLQKNSTSRKGVTKVFSVPGNYKQNFWYDMGHDSYLYVSKFFVYKRLKVFLLKMCLHGQKLEETNTFAH